MKMEMLMDLIYTAVLHNMQISHEKQLYTTNPHVSPALLYTASNELSLNYWNVFSIWNILHMQNTALNFQPQWSCILKASASLLRNDLLLPLGKLIKGEIN